MIGEVFPFVATPARVYNAKELANVTAIGHDVDGGDVEGWLRDVQRVEKWLERTVLVPCGVLSDVDMTDVFFNRKGTLGGDRRFGQPCTAMVGVALGASIQL